MTLLFCIYIICILCNSCAPLTTLPFQNQSFLRWGHKRGSVLKFTVWNLLFLSVLMLIFVVRYLPRVCLWSCLLALVCYIIITHHARFPFSYFVGYLYLFSRSINPNINFLQIFSPACLVSGVMSIRFVLELAIYIHFTWDASSNV